MPCIEAPASRAGSRCRPPDRVRETVRTRLALLLAMRKAESLPILNLGGGAILWIEAGPLDAGIEMIEIGTDGACALPTNATSKLHQGCAQTPNHLNGGRSELPD